jgi:hypothetical protein
LPKAPHWLWQLLELIAIALELMRTPPLHLVDYCAQMKLVLIKMDLPEADFPH